MTPKAAGRTIGLIMLAQVALAPVVYLRMLEPVRGSGFLEAAAANAPQVRLALFLSLIYGAMTMAMAILAWPILKRQSELAALSFFTVTLVGVIALLIDDMGRYELLHLSERFVVAGAPQELLRTMGVAARDSWRMAHFTYETFAHVTIFAFNAVMFRCRLVPRWLSAAGMAGTILSASSTSMPLLGLPFMPRAIFPMIVVQLTLMVWLLTRGFAATSNTKS
jgi:hypothetical protein